jgi:hypothetical protein
MWRKFCLRPKFVNLYLASLASKNVIFGGINGFANNDPGRRCLQKMKKGLNMKLKIIGAGFAACLVAALLGGCGKKETPPPTTTEIPKAAESATTNAPEAAPTATTAEKAAATAVTETTQAVSQAAAATSTQTAAETSQVQGLIDQAKSLVDQKKYQDALDTLKQLGNSKLTAEQQNLVDGLKAQIQKLMAAQATSEATKSVGGLLGK